MPILPNPSTPLSLLARDSSSETIPLSKHHAILTTLTKHYNTRGLQIIIFCFLSSFIILLLFLAKRLWLRYHPERLVEMETARLEGAVRRYLRLGEGRGRGAVGVRRVWREREGRTGRGVGREVEVVVGRVVREEMGVGVGGW
ncbi:hypothetical protein ONS95_005923 [Cadophora gregata]|uniref:uncharacterized protein n=1 Tax=Cadophora gregata TaxID=51156 RepID=UPI0026DBA711|nr:uncharacterized protein ONS95_005923 [Cadophora gregata]KAK0102300.1 hypothetical protein ONS95_005923 [Cadophora gregata]KAK0103926.1 hypothetical protein ONS96_005033 [Cadophora gregata f. sp. sojae]